MRSDTYLIANVGWMDRYQGLKQGDRIVGGGSYVGKRGYGHEIYNFAPHAGRLYGNVYPGPALTINLEKLGGLPGEKQVAGVTVVWTATHPVEGGRYVVGWYKNAIVHSKWLDSPKGAPRTTPDGRESCEFNIVAKVQDATLLNKDERLLPVPKGKGGMGTCNTWFADSPKGEKFLQKVADLIKTGVARYGKKAKRHTGSNGRWQQDLEKRLRIEELAMTAVGAYYTDLGYQVTRVHHQNFGWDMDAKPTTAGRSTLKVEVKGLSGNSVDVELTPNEYSKMNRFSDTYRLCVVTQAEDAKARTLNVFSFSTDMGKWENQDGKELQRVEVVAARASMA